MKIYPQPRLSSGNPILSTKETKKESSLGEAIAKSLVLPLVSETGTTLNKEKKKKRELSGETPFKNSVVIFS